MKELKRSEDVKKILTSSKPVAVVFYLTGCPHCEVMDPIWSSLEKDYPAVEFLKAESAAVPPALGISGFPTFMKIEGGTIAARLNGEMTRDDLKSKLLGKSGGRRRRSTRFRTRRRKHGIHRTTRRRIPLRLKLASTR